MSDYATPETYAAWRYLEDDDALRPHDREHAEIMRGGEELALLYSELEKSPTVENMLRFFKRAFELRCFTQSSLARSLKRYHCQNICFDELEARAEAYPCFGTEEVIRHRVKEIRRHDGELAQVAAKVEEGLRHRAEDEERLATVNALVARWRASQ